MAAFAAVTVLLATVVTVSTIGLVSPSASATPRPSATGALPSPSASGSLMGPGVDAAGPVGTSGFWARRGSDLYISTDAGATWSVGTVDASASSIVVLDADHAWDVTVGPGSTEVTDSPTDVLHYVVNRTTDGGKTWQSVAIDGNFPAMRAVLSFPDVNHGFLLMSRDRFATQDSSVFRTDNGGTTWRKVGSAPSLGPMFVALDTQKLWAGGQGSAAPVRVWPALSESKDGGATWQEVQLPGDPRDVLGPPTFFQRDGVIVAGNQDGVYSVLRTIDGGNSWATVDPVNYAGRIGPGSFLNRDLWFIADADGGEIALVTERGSRWVRIPTNGLPAAPWWIGFVDPQRGAALAPLGDSPAPGSEPPQGLFITSDGGRDWKPAVFPGNAPVATPTATQSSSPTPNPPGLAPSGIGFWDAQHGLMAGTLIADGTGVIWRTSDGGVTWDKTLYPASPFSYLAVVGPRYAWVGIVCSDVEVPCSPALMASTDAGETWQRLGSEAFVSMSFTDAQRGWAVRTFGSVAWRGSRCSALHAGRRQDLGHARKSLPDSWDVARFSQLPGRAQRVDRLRRGRRSGHGRQGRDCHDRRRQDVDCPGGRDASGRARHDRHDPVQRLHGRDRDAGRRRRDGLDAPRHDRANDRRRTHLETDASRGVRRRDPGDGNRRDCPKLAPIRVGRQPRGVRAGVHIRCRRNVASQVGDSAAVRVAVRPGRRNARSGLWRLRWCGRL
jgi:photosystem II stability/assembly factor-like uncharacterized protein